LIHLVAWLSPCRWLELGLGGVCFSFSSLLWISFQEIQKLDGPKS
jgi:hypothetical protein